MTKPTVQYERAPNRPAVMEAVVDAAFGSVAGLCGVLFFLICYNVIRFSPAFAALILILWSPLFWLKYWLNGRARRGFGWIYFLCAIGVTATALLAAVLTLIRMVAATW